MPTLPRTETNVDTTHSTAIPPEADRPRRDEEHGGVLAVADRPTADGPGGPGTPGASAGSATAQSRAAGGAPGARHLEGAVATAGPPPSGAALEHLVVLSASGEASPEQVALLEAHPEAWAETLHRVLSETTTSLRGVRRLTGPERDQVVADFEKELARYTSALVGLVGHRAAGIEPGPEPATGLAEPTSSAEPEVLEPGTTVLQLSWAPGRVVAWGGGHNAPAATVDQVTDLLAAAGAPGTGWTEQAPVALLDETKAEALAAPVSDVLGWLVALHADPEPVVGPSVRWLARVAAVAVSLVARGRMVPLLRQSKSTRNAGRGPGSFSVRWSPALVDERVLNDLAGSLPGSVAPLDARNDGRAVTQGVLAGIVDAICRTAAARIEVPAPPPNPRTSADVAETFLARLDGSRFEAPPKAGGELSGRLERWAKPVTSPVGAVHLILQLAPPDDVGAWLLSVLAAGIDRHPVPVEVALVTAPDASRRQVEHHLARLERLLPVLRRPGGPRRGQVVLDQDEAWELMARTGATVEAAGYEVRLPTLSRRKPTPYLRLFSEGQESVVGAHQLANVRWSAVFDDVELDATEIARLAAQARPLVRSRGRWVALDHADLAEAAAALAERASTTQLTGAAMLRHALGLEGSSLAGGIKLEGSGWAVNLFERALEAPTEPRTSPEGFVGTLRTYQAEALAWLGFLESTGLGGCLALDMGLGKTPTVLAHLRETRGGAPALVIAPPAVVGNWAAEASRFTPGLRVVVHHGSDRASTRALAGVASRADVVLTTYGTAVRDIDALEDIEWGWVVLDEAQVIKNPQSETSQQLRRLRAKGKVALTGTPIENGLGDLWAILDFTNPGLVGARPAFIAQLSREGDARGAAEGALRALNGILVFRRTKAEPAIAAELPDRIDELDHCAMTPEQIGLYQAVLDNLVTAPATNGEGTEARTGQVLAAITALKQICNHPAAYQDDDPGRPLDGRSGKLARLEEIVEDVFAAGEKVLIFTHFATWGQRLAVYLSRKMGTRVACYHGGLARGARDKLISDFQSEEGPGALVLSLKAGGTGLNLTAASHVVLYDRWWNPAVEDQARDRAWRIGQTRTVVAHRLVCPGTVDERVEEVVAGKRRIADLVLPRSSSLGDLDASQLRTALGLRPDQVLTEDDLCR
ncbi:MAG: ATP-dependent helicase [Acidimicrobiia bacterium]|nr:ATP-dependent helicase [Acidimicrobiia bacterium]